MKIAVDIMSGDNAPSAIIEGALLAAKDADTEVVLVGDEAVLATVDTKGADGRISFMPSSGVVEMQDPPSYVMKEKADSSMATAARLLRDGGADALVSAGNTGALFTAASLTVRRLRGVRRAAIGSVINLENPIMMLDMGANTDCTPQILDLFARMGSLYSEGMLGVKRPRVALLNNGSESTKGTELYRSAYELLSNDDKINFVGNCEGNMIPLGFCDVLVCDGFSGNICLKTMEGVSSFAMQQIKQVFKGSLAGNIAGLLIKSKIPALKSKFSAKGYGGAPILGIKKPVIKAHGNSDANAICAAVRQAKKYAESGIIDALQQGLADMGGESE